MTAFSRLLLPPHCLVCGDAGEGDDLCRACRDALPWNHAHCMRCGLPLPQSAAACGECLRDPPDFVATLAPLRYETPADRLLTAFKFQRDLAAGRLLATLCLASLEACDWRDAIALVVPVPLHPQRLGQRGYNQALELARPLARRLRCRLDAQVLRRVRATPAQTELDGEQRRRNVRGAFAAEAGALAARDVLLVDDVITTGATVREAARVLLRAGAASVRVLAVARAARGRGSA